MIKYLVSYVSFAGWVNAAGPGSGAGQSAGAGSPFTNFTAGVLAYGILVAVLVSVLLIGAFLILNLGLLSKREQDKIGKRTPSEVGILKNNIWPPEPYLNRVLPAEEDDFTLESPPPENPDPSVRSPKKAA